MEQKHSGGPAAKDGVTTSRSLGHRAIRSADYRTTHHKKDKGKQHSS